MEDNLTQTLSALSNVKSVKVHLNIPEQNGTLASRAEEASAFIQLELDGTFTSANAANVARSVASFLHNETTANITIMDSDANILFAGGDDYSTAGIANSMQELQNQAESMISNQVRRVLYGTNQYSMIEVSSHLNMDYSSYEEAVKEYYANEGRDEGMIAHQDSFNSENTSAVGGPPGTDSNDGTTYVWDTNSDTSSSQAELSTDYLPNESLVNKVTPAGAINYGSSSISVAAITYREIHEEDVRRQGLLDGGTTWEEYKSLNSADRRMTVDPEFYEMVANATGINEDRITIIAYETPVFYDRERMQINWSNVLSIVMLIVILGLLALVVVRSMTARTEVTEEEELSVEELLQSTPEAELEDIDVESKSDTRRMIEKFVDDNPEAAAALLRNWLNEDWG
ncbi:MAG: flagellar M-ring protein FliF, partial [Lachnospiraceae bacterium]|nr:flagellar M-ring protein FliF [Lachnospiraceae bacterium]